MRVLLRRLVMCLALAACTPTKPAPVRPLPPMSSSAYAYYLDGKLAAYRSDWDAAVASLREAAKAAPDQPMIAVELAKALSKAKKEVAARETLARARAKWPDHPQVWRVSGDLLRLVRRRRRLRLRERVPGEPLARGEALRGVVGQAVLVSGYSEVRRRDGVEGAVVLDVGVGNGVHGTDGVVGGAHRSTLEAGSEGRERT